MSAWTRGPRDVRRMFEATIGAPSAAETPVLPPPPRETAQVERAAAWGTSQFRVAASSVTVALGLLLIQASYTASRSAENWAEPIFWAGFVLIIVPGLVHVALAGLGRGERQAVLVVIALGLFGVKVLYSPVYFSFGDELQHLRSAQDLLATGRLFAQNPILPVSPSFPGFESVTSAVVSLSGLSIFVAGMLVVGTAKIVGILALFALYELLTGSPRIASLGVLLYASNPHFVFFDSQFAYESLGIPLVAFTLVAIARHTLHSDQDHLTTVPRSLVPLSLLGICAVVVTHHVSAYVLLVILATWSVVSLLNTSWEVQSGRLTAMTAFTIAAILGWTWFVASNTLDYLAGPLRNGLENLAALISGEAAARELFQSNAAPAWVRVASFLSVIVILLVLALGLRRIWRAAGISALVVTLALLASSYPFVQALRFSSATLTLATRSAPYVFLGVGLVAALALPALQRSTRRPYRIQLLTVALVGAVFIGTMASTLSAWSLPGGYRPDVYTHTVGPEGLALAGWARTQLGPDNRFGADDPNTLILAAYGRQRPITQQLDGVSLADQLFPSNMFGPREQALLKNYSVRYLVVDRRTGTRLVTPGSGALHSRLDGLAGVDRLYDSGDIVVYDLGGSPSEH